MAYQSKLVRCVRALWFTLSLCAGVQGRAVVERATIAEQCVALADMPCEDVQWQLVSKDGYTVYDLAHDSRKKYTDQESLIITCVDGQILLNGVQTLSNNLYIIPQTCKASYQNTLYEGAFGIECDEADAILYYYPLQKSSIHLEPGKSKSLAEPRKRVAAREVESHQYDVRVLLDEHEGATAHKWMLRSEHGFVATSRQDSANEKVLKQPTLTVTCRADSIYLNGELWPASGVFIKPVAGLIAYAGNKYQGTFSVRFLQDRALLINILDLEDYVHAVVCAEGWPGWPLEFNKAMAIAARSYVIAMVMRMRTHAVPYHIKNTNVHQCYNGLQHDEVRKRAVEETQGVFLAHGGKPIVAMFDACCGGIIPAKMHDVNCNMTPYLARDKVCAYCVGSKVYIWQADYTFDRMVAILKKEYPRLKKIRSVSVTRVDKAGIVMEVAFRTDRGTIVLSGKKMHALFKLRSFCYTIAKRDQKIVIKGRGYGHHKGLCQWGAREMVRQGWDYKSILQFYYPHTTFMRLPEV